MTLEQSVPPQGRIKELKQVTNVLGGAFMPAPDGKGNLTYSSWNESGYKIHLIKNIAELDSVINEKKAVYLRPDRLIGKYASQNDSNSSAVKNKFDWKKLRNFDDSTSSSLKSSKYSNASTPLFFIPVLRLDNYTKTGNFADVIKPGLYFYAQDVLGKLGRHLVDLTHGILPSVEP